MMCVEVAIRIEGGKLPIFSIEPMIAKGLLLLLLLGFRACAEPRAVAFLSLCI